jgi:hypothetical protein
MSHACTTSTFCVLSQKLTTLCYFHDIEHSGRIIWNGKNSESFFFNFLEKFYKKVNSGGVLNLQLGKITRHFLKYPTVSRVVVDYNITKK